MPNRYSVHLKLILYASYIPVLKKALPWSLCGWTGRCWGIGGRRGRGRDGKHQNQEGTATNNQGSCPASEEASILNCSRSRGSEQSDAAALERRARSDWEKGPHVRSNQCGAGGEMETREVGREGGEQGELCRAGSAVVLGGDSERNSPQELLCAIYNLFCALSLGSSVLN